MRQQVNIIDFDCDGIHYQRAFFNKMVLVFHLPNFFHNSFDSLNDCMRDLSWIPENYLMIHFSNLNHLKRANAKLYLDVINAIEIWQTFWQVCETKTVIIDFLK